jgi:dolichol-phosphate mannosyltransferase
MNTQKNLEKNFISAVVYAHNEEKRIADFLTMLKAELEKYFGHYEIIIVNDDSTDGTADEIRRVAAGFDNSVVSILKMSFYQGLEISMNAGKKLAIGDYVYEFDCIDGCYDAELIFEIYKQALKGYDIVSAVPQGKRRMSSKLFYAVFNRFSNVQYKLETENFRILSRRAINRIDSSSTTIPYRKAIYANCGLKYDKITYPVTGNSSHQEEGDYKYRKQVAMESLILHTNVAYKVSTALTLLMMAVTLLALVYTIVVFLTGHPVAGWTTMMLVLSFGFFGMFAILSFVIRYLSIILDLNYSKQRAVFESIEKISK